MKYDYFIIGTSAAAVGCIEGIRRESKNGKICVVSDENYRAYGRPLISYFLWGKTSEENMLKYRPKDFYEKNGADLILGTRALASSSVIKLNFFSTVSKPAICGTNGREPAATNNFPYS